MNVDCGLEHAREEVLEANTDFPSNPDDAFELGYKLGVRDGYSEGYDQGQYDAQEDCCAGC